MDIGRYGGTEVLVAGFRVEPDLRAMEKLDTLVPAVYR